MSLHVYSRKTGVFLSHTSHTTTGGLEGRKARRGDSVSLHVDIRNTRVLLSLNSRKTGGLKIRKARGQRVPARRQS